MNRTVKQFLYGAVYLIFWFAIFYGGYQLTLKPPASCVDSIQNRDEEGIDCGGSYCINCAIKNLKPIDITVVRLLPSADGARVSALVELRNPNVAYGAKIFSFDFGLYASGGGPVYSEHVNVPVYPSELKEQLFINLPVAFSDELYAQTTSTAVAWTPLTDFSKPRTPVREVHTAIDVVAQRATVTGILQNDNAFSLHRITINGMLSTHDSTLIGVSKTVVQDVIPKEERFFQLTIPLSSTSTELMADDIDSKIFIEAER